MFAYFSHLPAAPVADVATGACIGIAAAAAVVFLIVGLIAGNLFRKRVSEREIGSAEEEAKRIINESIKNAENRKREALLEVKDEIYRQRTEYEKEEKQRRADLQKQERRLSSKEETLDRKIEQTERRQAQLAQKILNSEQNEAELQKLKADQLSLLERISGFTTDEAKQYLLAQLESEVTHEQAVKIREIEARFKDEAETKARQVLSLAIQKCAADHVA